MPNNIYIIYYLLTGVIDCKSCHTIKFFKLVMSFFSSHHLQVKFVFTHSRLSIVYSENGLCEAVSAYILEYRYRYLDICMIRKTFLTVLLNLH